MNVQVLNKSKFICLGMTSVVALGLFVSTGTSVYASEINNTVKSDSSSLSLRDMSNQALPTTGEVYFNNSDILNYIKENDPQGYNTLSQDDIDFLLREDMLRAGSNRITFSVSGFKIYLSSSTAKWAKDAGSVAVAGLFGAIATAAGSPIAGAIAAAAGAALTIAITNWDVSRGIWVSFNWIGGITGHGKQ
ncbi:hypothetical protein [Enterococcus thailandicus]|uniref:hypothetical protein n=1 Tax=Enterococcus thailandicus TaxID=417368 RepID=UPI0022DFC261|nr:hypothetical protein [Enterococcus thailandicus]